MQQEQTLRPAMKPLQILLLAAILTCPAHIILGQGSPSIRLNQIGFHPDGPKEAVILNTGSVTFHVTSPAYSETLMTGTVAEARFWSYSGEVVGIADFSSAADTGSYVLVVPGLGTSHPFVIRPHVHEAVGRAALKGFYYQRASTRLYPQHAGVWARSAGHPDTAVLVHPSAATAERPANSTIRSPLGWYDAGDYNKYVVNSGITTGTLLGLYEDFPSYFAGFATGIPETGNALPDILDEVLWNLRWMLSMQDPSDGGVYAKLTNPNFDGWILPAFATQQRYVVMKSTAAALNLAAVAAQASRVFAGFTATMPGFADSCLQAALRAWRWARTHPSVFYRQGDMNAQFDPDIETGEYGDSQVSDEFVWSATELFVTTRADSFLSIAGGAWGSAATVPWWQDVRTMALYTLARDRRRSAGSIDTTAVVSRLVALAASLRTSWQNSAYHVPMGAHTGDFTWGSNAVAANQGIALLQGFILTGDSSYLRSATSSLDYLLGRNATTYCFLTGFGLKTPLNPHHRPSRADAIAKPVPGLLVGGPNPDQQDHAPGYPSNLPARSYTDHVDSYASNEIAINWNAAFVALALGIEALRSPSGPATDVTDDTNGTPREDDAMLRSYPNPFNPATKMWFSLAEHSTVTLKVYSALGAEVASIFSGALPAGVHVRNWDATGMPSGMYFGRLSATSSFAHRDGERTSVLKLMVIR